MMKTIFVVIGNSGVYDDAQEWLVRAFPEREVAEGHATLCREQVDSAFELLRDSAHYPLTEGFVVAADPYCKLQCGRICYTERWAHSVFYRVAPVDFVEG